MKRTFKDGGFLRIHNEIFSKGLGVRDVAVYGAISCAAFGDKHECAVSYDTLAERLGCNRKTVSAAVDSLESMGLIKTTRKRNCPVEYILLDLGGVRWPEPTPETNKSTKRTTKAVGSSPPDGLQVVHQTDYHQPISSPPDGLPTSTKRTTDIRQTDYQHPPNGLQVVHQTDLNKTEDIYEDTFEDTFEDSEHQEHSAYICNNDEYHPTDEKPLSVDIGLSPVNGEGLLKMSAELSQDGIETEQGIVAEDSTVAEEHLVAESLCGGVPPIPYCDCDDYSNWGSCDHRWSKEQWSRYWEERAEAAKVPKVRAVFTPPPNWKSKRSGLQNTTETEAGR